MHFTLVLYFFSIHIHFLPLLHVKCSLCWTISITTYTCYKIFHLTKTLLYLTSPSSYSSHFNLALHHTSHNGRLYWPTPFLLLLFCSQRTLLPQWNRAGQGPAHPQVTDCQSCVAYWKHLTLLITSPFLKLFLYFTSPECPLPHFSLILRLFAAPLSSFLIFLLMSVWPRNHIQTSSVFILTP